MSSASPPGHAGVQATASKSKALLGSDGVIPDSDTEVDHSFSQGAIEKQLDGTSQSLSAPSDSAPATLRIRVPAKRQRKTSSAIVAGDASPSSSDVEMLSGPSKLRLTLKQPQRHNPETSSMSSVSASSPLRQDARRQLNAESDADDDHHQGKDIQDARRDKGKKKAKAKEPSKKRKAAQQHANDSEVEVDGPRQAEESAAKRQRKSRPMPVPRKTNNSAQTQTAAALRILPYKSAETVSSEDEELGNPQQETNSVPQDSSHHDESHQPAQKTKQKGRGRDSAVAFNSPLRSGPAEEETVAPSTLAQKESPAATGNARRSTTGRSSRQHSRSAAAATATTVVNIDPELAEAPSAARSSTTNSRRSSRSAASAAESAVSRQAASAHSGDETEPLSEEEVDNHRSLSESEAEEEEQDELANGPTVPSKGNKKQSAAQKRKDAAAQEKQNVQDANGDNAQSEGTGMELVRVQEPAPDATATGPGLEDSHQTETALVRTAIDSTTATSNALVPSKVGKVVTGSKKLKPNSLAAIMARTVPTGIRRPGLSKSQRIPHLHRNIAPPPPKKALPSIAKKWDSDDDGEEFLSKKEIERRKRVDAGDEEPTEDDIRRQKRIERYKNNGW